MLQCIRVHANQIKLVQVVSSLANPIEEHMMGEEDDQDHPGSCCSHDHDHGCSHDHNHPLEADQHTNGKQHQGTGGNAHSAGDESHEDDSEEEGSDSDEDEGTADLVFPAEYSPALADLLSGSQVRVADIRLPNDELRLDLAVTLWKEGIVCMRPVSSLKPAKKLKK